MSGMIRAGIFGATGYTGYELTKLLLGHAETKITFATSQSSAGLKLSDLYPCPYDVELIAPESAELDQIDVAFFCLPHGQSMSWVSRACGAGVKAIDLSADFRLRDVGVYEQWYKVTHTAPQLLTKAVYGLPEIYRDKITAAELVAGPGCYPTSVLLALYPLVRGNYLGSKRIIVDSKSGVSGAGRKSSVQNLFVEIDQDFRPYAVGRTHRHLPEMEQELQVWREDVWVTFSPHLLPVRRGILSTIYVTLEPGWSVDRLVSLYREAYANEPFVHILPNGQFASLSFVANTNRCALSFAEVGEDEFIVVSAIDNLLKGASGQLVQCMNLMFGLDESMGLPR
jgi:N-acetyl-gamma-glutamyl-phosphate reductase